MSIQRLGLRKVIVRADASGFYFSPTGTNPYTRIAESGQQVFGLNRYKGALKHCQYFFVGDQCKAASWNT